jgi:hypothetical protein
MSNNFLGRYANISMFIKAHPKWTADNIIFLPDYTILNIRYLRTVKGYPSYDEKKFVISNKGVIGEPFSYGLTYKGKFLEGSEAFNRVDSPVRIEKIGKYVVAYAFSPVFAEGHLEFKYINDRTEMHKEYKAITAYAIYDAETLKLLKARFMANISKNMRSRRSERIADYSSIMEFDRNAKAFYTYARGLKAQGKLIIDLLKDSGVETHSFDVDHVCLDSRNPIYGKLYGVKFENNKAKIVAVLKKGEGNEIVTPEVDLPGIDINNAIIDDIKVRILPDRTAGMYLTFYNALSNNGKDEVISVKAGNWDKDLNGSSLIGELPNGIKIYVEEYISPDENKHPASYVIYKNGKVIQRIPFSLSYSHTSNKKSLTTDLAPLSGSFNSIVATSGGYFYSQDTDMFVTQVVYGKKHFAIMDWWTRKGSATLHPGIRVLDYDGNIVKKFKPSYLRDRYVLMGQDLSSHYIVMKDRFLTIRDSYNSDVAFHAFDVDTLKTISAKSIVAEYVQHDPIVMSLPHFESVKVCCNRIIIYKNVVLNAQKGKPRIHVSEIIHMADLNSNRVYGFRYVAPDKTTAQHIYVQDPYMVLSGDLDKSKEDSKGENIER